MLLYKSKVKTFSKAFYDVSESEATQSKKERLINDDFKRTRVLTQDCGQEIEANLVKLKESLDYKYYTQGAMQGKSIGWALLDAKVSDNNSKDILAKNNFQTNEV